MSTDSGFALTHIFKQFFKSEKAGGLLLIFCTIVSLLIANTGAGEGYIHFWHSKLDLSFAGIRLDHSVEAWINDGLMTIFFLLVGLEIERELYIGELSDFKNALLPIIAAVGGMAAPALIHFSLNHGTATQDGIGIPMATDIAFSLGILSLLGNKVPASLKIFLTALAIIDDLGAVIIIAIFYTKNFSLLYFSCAIGIFLLLLVLNRLKVYALWIYLIIGVLMWYCMFRSGVHATISGVLLAFAIPFHKEDRLNPSHKLQHALHYPVSFFIVPLFALANTGIHLAAGWQQHLLSCNSLGIALGLLLGKPLGIFLCCRAAVKMKYCTLPEGTNWKLLLGAGILAGIGFTMSIFITNLAFTDIIETIDESKIAVLLASLLAALAGLLALSMAFRKPKTD